jgi:hypothetical protein
MRSANEKAGPTRPAPTTTTVTSWPAIVEESQKAVLRGEQLSLV